MMTKEEVISALKYDNAMITFDPMTGEDVNLESLNEANRMHYEANLYCINMLKPKPYAFEDLKEDMFIFDSIKNRVNRVIETFVADFGIPYIKLDDGFGEWFIVEFENNRFYPAEKANLGKQQ